MAIRSGTTPVANECALDAHALIWFLGSNPRLGANARSVMQDPTSVFVPARHRAGGGVLGGGRRANEHPFGAGTLGRRGCRHADHHCAAGPRYSRAVAQLDGHF